ncbi:MAG: hypothetical protein AAF296_11565 [Pseudomonadota bacterium]
MENQILETELRRLEDTLEANSSFSYQSMRGVDDEDNDVNFLNFVVWEATDFACSRTGKYDIIKEELDDVFSDGVKMIAGALAASLDFISAGAVLIIESVLRIVIKYSANGACGLLPLVPPH